MSAYSSRNRSQVDPLLAAGPGKEGAEQILTSVLGTKDPTLISRFAGAYGIDTEAVRSFLEQRNKPTAIGTFVAGCPAAAKLLKPIWDSLKSDEQTFKDAVETLVQDSDNAKVLIDTLDQLSREEEPDLAV